VRRRQVTKKPVIEHLRLPALDEASIEALRPHADHECLHIDGGSLTELALPGATLRECELLGVAAHTADLQATRLIESRLERFSAPTLRASGATLRDVEIVGSRIGALDIHDAEIRTTRFVGCKFDWINLRASTLEDVVFEGCTIGELDLTGAAATRVSFVDSRADVMALARARLADVDLRGLEMGQVSNLEGMKGATLDALQVTALATTFAGHLGIRVEG